MAQISTREFLPLVLPHVPGAPIPTVERQIRSAAIEFCERTRCWRHLATLTVETQGEIIAAPEYAAIHEIENASFNGRPLTAIPFGEVFRPAYEDSGQNQQPDIITQVGPNTVMLYPFAEGDLELSLFLKPRQDSDFTRPGAVLADFFNQVPDFLLHQHGEVIAWGAISRIMALPGQPFTSPDGAAAYGGAFQNALDSRFTLHSKGQHRAPKRTKTRFF